MAAEAWLLRVLKAHPLVTAQQSLNGRVVACAETSPSLCKVQRTYMCLAGCASPCHTTSHHITWYHTAAAG